MAQSADFLMHHWHELSNMVDLTFLLPRAALSLN